MIRTDFYYDFIEYYKKAKKLQEWNLTNTRGTQIVGDPIMDHVTIYDVVQRRHAGFSKALQDIHGRRVRKDLVRYDDVSEYLDMVEFHYLYLFHRFTGSGASFRPTFLSDGSRNPQEHGYFNNHVGRLATIAATANSRDEENWTSGSIIDMADYIIACKEPMVTSIGNQPPSLKNPEPDCYRLAMQYYFAEWAEGLVQDYCSFLIQESNDGRTPIGIKQGVDWVLDWHSERGFKRWKFVLTAFVMDTADYWSDYVSPESHCYHGNNCIKAFDLMFDRESKDPKKDVYYDACMQQLVDATGGRPYDLEDVCCDAIRYWGEYVPKGYDHLKDWQRQNNSTLKTGFAGEYKPEYAKRVLSVIFNVK